jgi:hypothetical protein
LLTGVSSALACETASTIKLVARRRIELGKDLLASKRPLARAAASNRCY